MRALQYVFSCVHEFVVRFGLATPSCLSRMSGREISRPTHARFKSFEVHEVVHDALVRLFDFVQFVFVSEAREKTVVSADVDAGLCLFARRECPQSRMCGHGPKNRSCRPSTFKVPIVASPPGTLALADPVTCCPTEFFSSRNGWQHQCSMASQLFTQSAGTCRARRSDMLVCELAGNSHRRKLSLLYAPKGK